VIVPCAGGSLLTKIAKAMQELQMLGLIPEPHPDVRGAGRRMRAHRPP